MVVGDYDLCLVDFREHVGGEDLAGFVVAVHIVGQEDIEAILDGDTRSDDEEAFGKELGSGIAGGVDRLPCDDHGHHDGLPRASGELEGDAEQGGVRLGVGGFQVLLELLILRLLGRDFGEPDRGFNSLDLAEEGAQAAIEIMMAPVLEEAGGFRGDVGAFPALR